MVETIGFKVIKVLKCFYILLCVGQYKVCLPGGASSETL